MSFKKIFGAINPEPPFMLRSIDAMQAILIRERARADRNYHQFSVIVFDLGNEANNVVTIKKLDQFLSTGLRTIDEAGWFAKNQIGIILPYTRAGDATKLAERIQAGMKDIAPLDSLCIYKYPSVWPFNKKSKQKNVARKPKRIAKQLA
ncbi:MAG: hypothetical protein DWQ10_10050 [Calditrichaeota bacterium]|nr:MAG: hypothetical protein DWQ10_10050 [Calditrichota bacterium]